MFPKAKTIPEIDNPRTSRSEHITKGKPGKKYCWLITDYIMHNITSYCIITILGKAPAGLFPETIPEIDTPRTYRSEHVTKGKPGKKGQDDEESALITSYETKDMLNKTFNYFRRAVVCEILYSFV